ncbi:MAG: MMPL family transporter [Desulfobacteraceae bacterium]|jgi:predicted RND superfamily exporter protein|nr:MMPL family transporter [Desulfobacteraceae bacterium]
MKPAADTPGRFLRFFDGTVIRRPRTVMVVLALVFTVLAYHARDFRLDASSETLMLEHDADLAYARQVTARYGEPSYLLVAYAPRGDLLDDAVLERIAALRDALKQVPSVSSVLTILDLPLLESPPVPVKDLAANLRTLTDPLTDRELARRELQQSPLFHNLLVGPDLKTTALVVTFEHDQRWDELRSRRDALRDKSRSEGLTGAEEAAYKEVSAEFLAHRDQQRRKWHATIVDIRSILDGYRDDADVFLGGVEMIADDMLTFIRNDLKVFGTGVFVFLVLILWLLFRNWRWVVIPLICCSASALTMVGILGWCNWEVTVISSNFISLQLIITMAVTIHLIVRYRELFRRDPDADQQTLIRQTVALMIKPCVFTTLTTVAGFASLVFSDIKPVITFGWMMIVGLVVSMVATFVLFPSVLMLLPRQKIPAPRGEPFDLPSRLARFTEGHGKFILTVSALALGLSAWGVSRLNVENAFIDYFKHSTEIYQGMKVIDQRLGGTTPLDVVVTLARSDSETTVAAEQGSDDGALDAFDAFAEFDEAADDPKYWFTRERMETATAVHDYLDGLPETGKVLSLATLVKIAQRLNDGQPLDNFTLALLFGELPQQVREILVDPYASVENDETRLSVRIIDSLPGLRRNALLQRIETDLVEKIGLAPDTFRLSGMMVLYNNMLQSLFQSQIMTLGATVLLLMAMFLILFRSLRIAVIAIFPNVLSIGVVLGFMGWAGIPLDMMTITIAAISVGIAVDDTIHYIHRFRREFPRHGTYLATMHFCHGSIGRAMFYTSVIFVMGFSILVLSNFIPTIYFGLLTGLAMVIALVAALTLLPALIVAIRPFGPENGQRVPQGGS